MSDQVQIVKAREPSDLAKVREIRRKVFIEEQLVPEQLEWENEENSVQFLATIGDDPAGCGRWRRTPSGLKIERMAVLAPYRGEGLGKKILDMIFEDLTNDPADVYLHAQEIAVPFYLKQGFVPVGERFFEAGIAHFKMILDRDSL